LGDFSPVGRLFSLGSFFMKISEAAQMCVLLRSCHGNICALILAKKGLGYIFGRFFFTNSSGRPVSSAQLK
jgi:hypothetical protein